MNKFTSLNDLKLDLDSGNLYNTPIDTLKKSKGYLGWGRKLYLSYNEQEKQLGIRCLNVFERMLRYFGFYHDTQKSVVMPKIEMDSGLMDSKQSALLKKIFTSIFPKETTPEEQGKKVSVDNDSTTSSVDNDSTTSQKEELVEFLKKELGINSKSEDEVKEKNILKINIFGDLDDPKAESPKVLDFQIDETTGTKIMNTAKYLKQFPGVSDYIFMNIRGDEDCGYRTLATGLLFVECIKTENVKRLRKNFKTAFKNHKDSWDELVDHDPEKMILFKTSYQNVVDKLELIKKTERDKRLPFLNDENFLNPFRIFIRYLTVTETFAISNIPSDRDIDREIRNIFNQLNLTEIEKEALKSAIENYTLDELISEKELPDLPSRESLDSNPLNQNKKALKETFKTLYKKNPTEINNLTVLKEEEFAASRKLDVDVLELPDIDNGDKKSFFKRKALNQKSSETDTSTWASNLDFDAFERIFNKHVGIIFGSDKDKGKFLSVSWNSRKRHVDFFGLNTSGVHYNLLIPKEK